MTKKISYLAKNFQDFKNEFISFTKQYYPSTLNDYNDASIGSWFMDLISAASDNHSFSIDKAFDETQLDWAQERKSKLAIARTNGLRIPGKKSSLVEVEISCEIPLDANGNPDQNYLPLIKKGTQAIANGQRFELIEDSDFSFQFNNQGVSNRTIVPRRDSNGTIIGYFVSKFEIMASGETKYFQKVINDYDITPFMEVILPETNVLSVESIIFKDGDNFNQIPNQDDFSTPNEYIASSGSDNTPLWRYFEVESLLEDKYFTDVNDNINTLTKTLPTEEALPTIAEVKSGNIKKDIKYTVTSTNTNNQNKIKYDDVLYGVGDTFTGIEDKTTYTIVDSGGTEIKDNYLKVTIETYYYVSLYKGMWKYLTQKFITEYTDKNYLKIIFGAGSNYNSTIVDNDGADITDTYGTKLISQIVNNKNMGVLPSPGMTMFIMYRVGGGANSNIAKGALRTLTTRNVSIVGEDSIKRNSVINSMTVVNTSPSVSGKDEPTEDEIRMMIKYNNQAQNRVVTIKDYYERIMKMPARYGTPYRLGIIEVNNQILISILSTDINKKLTNNISITLMENMTNYLSEYKMFGDYIVIQPGKIVNLQIEADVIIDKSYNKAEVKTSIINKINNFMSIENHNMGDNIYISDLQNEIINIGGVINLIDLRVYNIYDDNYSKTRINQPVINGYWDNSGNWIKDDDTTRKQVDLIATDGILYSDTDTMFEIKYINKDIKIREKLR